MKKDQTTNIFNQGLVMDIHPFVTTNDTICNALNATLVTMDGNDNVLQNDMGNGRVESAFLPEGYVPLGTAELGGIIYIVSYNPISGTCQIGSFPSPERNITSDELQTEQKNIEVSQFYSDVTNKVIKSPFIKLILLDQELNPGDKFQIKMTGNTEYLSAYTQKQTFNHNLLPKYLKFNVVSISDSGKITNLNDSLVWHKTDDGYYYLKTNDDDSDEVDLDGYRNLIQSEYNVFNSKVSGKLGILAQLECIDTFDVTWDALKDGDNWNFYLYLNWSYNNEISKDKINLYGISYKINNQDGEDIIITNYPNSTNNKSNDVLINNIVNDDYETIYYTPPNINSLEEAINDESLYKDVPPSIRKNDGTDNQFLLTTPISVNNDGSTISLEITPTMPYGKLDWLKKEFNINLNKLGTGDISLIEYRYFVEKSSTTLNWGLEAYPERNKKIEDVTINFYEFDDRVCDYLKNIAENIDNDFIIESTEGCKWNNSGSSQQPIDSQESYQIISSNKNSYSGHFTDNISGLKQDSIYLVEIKINYNSEKYLYYYRILYACDIFNDKYYEVNDFKDIKLEDVIQENNLLGIQIQELNIYNEKIETVLKDSSNQIVESIPNYLLEKQTEYINYNFESTYNSDIEYTTEYKCPNCFNSKINTLNIGERREESVIDQTVKQLTNSNINNITNNIDPITETIKTAYNYEGNKITCKLNKITNLPLQILYNKSDYLQNIYNLDKVSISPIYLWSFGTSNAEIKLCVNDSFITVFDSLLNKNFPENQRDDFYDDVKVTKQLSGYPNVYSYIKDRLKYNDVVPIIAQAHYGSRAGSQGIYNLWGLGDSIGSYYQKYHVRSENGSGNNDCSLLFYAMLNTNNDIVLLTFGGNAKMGLTPYFSQRAWVPRLAKPVAFKRDQLTDEKLIIPVSYYYKPINSTETIQVYYWNIINYYEDPEWKLILKTKTNSNIDLYINEYKIDEVLQKINNFNYNNVRNGSLDVEISNTIITSDIVLPITTINTTQNYIKLPNGQLISKSISLKGIYNENGEKVNNLKIYKDSTLFKIDSKIVIICQDGFLRILSNNQKDKMTAQFEQEEQKIGISGITLVDDEQ